MIARHNKIAQFLTRMLMRANYTGVRNEVPNLVLGPHSQQRPDDIFVESYHGVATAFDVTIVNPINPSNLPQTLEKPLGAAMKAHQAKLDKYIDIVPNVEVIPLCFQTLGGFTPSVHQLLKDIALRSQFVLKVPMSVTLNQLTLRLSCLLMRGVFHMVERRVRFDAGLVNDNSSIGYIEDLDVVNNNNNVNIEHGPRGWIAGDVLDIPAVQ